jgi:cobalt-zinc-cadmium efflux system membrane fusion protein
MAVAQIPDLHNWEMTARIGELDRGHLRIGQHADIRVVALPGKILKGRVKDLGAVGGPFWNRNFECRIGIDTPLAEMRPGMSANIVITIEVLRNVLWAPAQALFESDGRTFVYVQTPEGFLPQDVKLVRRSESQVVLEGIAEGRQIALASPDQQTGGPGGRKDGAESGGAMKAISR